MFGVFWIIIIIMIITITIHIYFTCHKVRRYRDTDDHFRLQNSQLKARLNKNVFSRFLKIFRLSEKLKLAGSSFQITGAEALKARSPYFVLVSLEHSNVLDDMLT